MMLDCVIVGGGPAGLTAALYLARFRRSCLVIDGGESRANLIPNSHNFPTYPSGIAGVKFLAQLRSQLANYGIVPLHDTVIAIERCGPTMRVAVASGVVEARTVLLATGKKDIRPIFDDAKHNDAVLHGFVHYCPVCDAFEVTDRQVAVLGTGQHGVSEALFLRQYTSRIDLICPSGDHLLDPADAGRVQDAGIALVNGPVSGMQLSDDGIVFNCGSGSRHATDIYVALGCYQRSELARAVGAKVSDDGCIVVDAHQRTTVTGLYAAGDIVVGLDQLTTAVGHAAIAATAIRNDLLKGRQMPSAPTQDDYCQNASGLT